MNKDTIYNLLLKSDPWVRYNTKIHLLSVPKDDISLKNDKNAMVQHPFIRRILDELRNWPGYTLTNHRDANHPVHKLAFLADIGFYRNDAGIDYIATKVTNLRSEEGPFKIKIFIPKHFGGSGSEELAWILCDAPLILYSLIKLGYKDTPGVKEAVTFLLSLVRDNGWGCKCSNIFSKFRGPGRKGDICPYANMLMLKLISVLPELYNHKARKTGVNAFFELWKSQGVNKPYLFGIGSDFKKLKAPLVWYDILHILDILTCFPNLLNHSIIKEMIKLILEKADENGLYKAESVYRAWTGWDFGQKREPSYWISFLVYKILKRIKSTAKAAN